MLSLKPLLVDLDLDVVLLQRCLYRGIGEGNDERDEAGLDRDEPVDREAVRDAARVRGEGHVERSPEKRADEQVGDRHREHCDGGSEHRRQHVRYHDSRLVRGHWTREGA